MNFLGENCGFRETGLAQSELLLLQLESGGETSPWNSHHVVQPFYRRTGIQIVMK